MSSPNSPHKNRLETLDLFKGAFVIVMMINHFNVANAMMNYIGTHSTLLASVAEGFFAISGFLLGYTSFSMVHRRQWAGIFKKNTIRALKLFFIGFMLTLIYYLWSLKTGSRLYLGDRDMFMHFNSPIDFSIKSFFGVYIYGYHDILFNYAILIFFSPIFLFLAKNKKYGLALFISLVLWVINYIYPGRFDINNSSFNNLGWQIIFYPLVLMGYWLKSDNNKLKLKGLIDTLQQRRILYWVFVMAATLFVLSFYYGYLEHKHYPLFNNLIIDNSSRENMGPIRVVVFYLWLFSSLIFFYQKSILAKLKDSPHKFISTFTKMMMFFGRYSLQAYVIHFLFILIFYYIINLPTLMAYILRSEYLAGDISIILSILAIYYLAGRFNSISSYVKQKKFY